MPARAAGPSGWTWLTRTPDRPAEAEAVRERGVDRLHRGAEPGAGETLAAALDRADQRLDQTDRDREADPDRAAAAGEDRGVDADQRAIQGHERAARVAGVDRGIGLDERQVRADLRRRSRERRDDAAGHGLADAERVADREHEVADLERVGIAHRQRRQVVRLDVEDREVGRLVRAHHPGLELAPVGQHDHDLVGILDHVVVGHDQAVGARRSPRSPASSPAGAAARAGRTPRRRSGRRGRRRTGSAARRPRPCGCRC